MNRRPYIALLVSVVIAFSVVGRVSAQVALTPSAQVDHGLKFIFARDAPGTLDPRQVRQCFSMAMQLLKMPDSNMPHVLVIHASPDVAHAADVETTTVRIITREDVTYYEFWIVGEPQPVDYLRAVYTILEKHYHVQISKEDRKKTSLFVLRYISSTVSAHGGQ